MRYICIIYYLVWDGRPSDLSLAPVFRKSSASPDTDPGVCVYSTGTANIKET